jgi:hypothetical protein
VPATWPDAAAEKFAACFALTDAWPEPLRTDLVPSAALPDTLKLRTGEQGVASAAAGAAVAPEAATPVAAEAGTETAEPEASADDAAAAVDATFRSAWEENSAIRRQGRASTPYNATASNDSTSA